MSLDNRLKEHLRDSSDRIAVGEPDLAGVTKRGRRRRTVRYVATGTIAGTLFAAALLLPPRPQEQPVVTLPTPTTTVTTPTDSVPQPSDAETGSFDTPLGNVEWRRVTGDDDSIPFPSLGLVATASGFAAIGYEVEWNGSSGAEGWRYYESGDGYEWSETSLPVPVEPTEARILAAGDATWLITAGPETLWRSEDGENWTEMGLPSGSGTWGSIHDLQIYHVDGATWLIRGTAPGAFILDESNWIEVDTSVLQPPDITGGRWRIWTPSSPVTVSGTTIVPWPIAFDVDWVSILGMDPHPHPYSVWNQEAQAIEVWGSYGAGPVATFEAEVNGRRISLTDRESGEQVHEIVVNDPRIDPTTFVEDGLTVGEYQIAVVDEQGVVTPGVAPWGEPSPDWGQPFHGAIYSTLFANDQFVALIPARNQGEGVGVETWTSPDGVNWTGPSQPEFIDERPLPGLVRFQIEGAVMLAHLLRDFGEDVWVTTDGTNWSFTGLGDEGMWTLARLGSGGLFFRDFDLARGGMAASTDLQGWEPVDPGSLVFDFGDGAGGQSCWGPGDTFFCIHAAGTARQMYVVELQG